MKTLKNNKVLAWMLAVITACCAFLGVILTTPQNVALADDSATQITNDTFPDTSTWEEKIIETEFAMSNAQDVQDRLSGRIFRVYTYDQETATNYGFCFVVSGDSDLLTTTVLSKERLSGDITINNGYGNVAYKNYDEYFEFVFYAKEGTMIEFLYIQGSDDAPVSQMYSKGLMVELVEPEAQPGVDETPDAEKDKPLSDKVADFINENTGLAVTGSLVTIVAIGAVVYFIFFRKRR